MKKFFKIMLIVFSILIVILLGGYAYFMTQFPKKIPVPEMKISSTPQMLERGKYLANGAAGCIDCHSKRDYSKLAGPLIPGTEGMGGEDFGEGAGYIPAKNITSDKETGLGNWSDGEIFRALTMGIDKNGEPLAPMMPYLFLANLDENDIKSIIAYIRTLPPIKNNVKQHELNFPVNFIFRTLPAAPEFKKLPDSNDKISSGKYYSPSCMFCHSPMEKGDFVKDKLFSGGVEFPNPKGGIVRSANLTPDIETGIGNLTKEQFIEKFRNFSKPEAQNLEVKDGEYNTIMPWTFLCQMKEEDLGSIYEFLRTQKPVVNKVEKFSPQSKYSPQ